jgi:DNA-binding SARP family transcriptional activator
MAAPLRIVLLGTFQLSAGTTAVTTVNTPRLQALLAYLVLRRRAPQSRQQLAFLLWPDSTDAQARTNLRTLLHRLRAALPDADAFLTVDATGVCWRADASFTLDVVEFETALALGSSAEQAGAADTARAALEHATALYQGDLLPDCYDEWVLPERERLQRLALDALEHLVEHLERHRDYAAAIDYARRLLRLDSLREATYLRLMGLHEARGDRAGALRVYHTCATILDRELGVEPSPATRAAYARLVSGDALPTRPVVSAPVELPIGTVTFLFTDIQGSTRLWERHARRMSAALARHDAILREAIETHAGVVFRTAGDAICAAFTHAPDALTAALAAQRALQSERWGATGPLRVRMALHTGVAETRDGDYVGHPLNRLARILATGHGGQMLLSQATQELVCDCLPPEVALRDLGAHQLKDLTRAEHIFQLVTADLPSDFPPLKSLGAQPHALPIPPALPPPAMVALAPLLGRAAEWARAQAIWQAAASGRTRLLALAGEAGIGKTRLAEELVTWAGHQGAATAIARCYATEGDLAYAPVTEWLRADALRRRLARLEPIWLTEVARLVPDVLTERPDLPRPGPLTEHWQRRRLFEALARAILAGDRPLLLLIDDLQWCDRDALEWLHFLLRYEARARLLVVGTVRAEEAGADLAALLDDIRRNDQLTEIALGPLSQTDAAALAGHMCGRHLSASAAADLYTETEGNPLFVVESVRAGLVRDVQGHGGADEVAAPTRLPPGVQVVISHRLNQITPAARELVCLAAVIGRSFSFGVLARAAESDEDALVRGLDELWQRRIVREQGADAYDFSHDKLRAVAYSGLSAARRRVLHRRVAEALEAEHAANLDVVSGQIAAHYERAGQFERALAYYQQAASVAQQVYANAEAIDALRRALALLSTATSGEPLKWRPTAAALNERLGDLLHLTGQYAEARSAYQRAMEFIAEENRPARAHLHRKIGNAWRDQTRYEEVFAAYTAAEAALSIAPDETDHELWQMWMQIQSERIQTYYWLAQVPQMFRLIEATRPIAERYGAPMHRARIFHFLAIAGFRRNRSIASEEILAHQQAYLAALEQSGATGALPAARFGLGFYLLWHDDLGPAEEQILAALGMAERTGDISLEARCLTYLTIIGRKRGQFDTVYTYAERSIRVAMAEQMPDYIGAAHANLAWLAWRVGNRPEARAHGQQALTAWRGTSLVFASQWTALWPLIAVALAENQVAEAAEYARALLDLTQQRPPAVLEAALEATVRAANLGDLEAARAEIASVLDPARALGYL